MNKFFFLINQTYIKEKEIIAQLENAQKSVSYKY